MGVFSKVFKPLRQVAEAVFVHDVALRRGPGGVQVVIEPRRDQRAPPSAEERAVQRARAELTLVRAELAALLDAPGDTRGALRHLAFVEKALGEQGLRTLHKLPLEVLERALDQLESLVTNWSPVGLATLRAKLAVAVADARRNGTAAAGDESSAMPEVPASLLAPLEVTECADEAALAAAYAALGAVPAAAEPAAAAPAQPDLDRPLEFEPAPLPPLPEPKRAVTTP